MGVKKGPFLYLGGLPLRARMLVFMGYVIGEHLVYLPHFFGCGFKRGGIVQLAG